MRKAILTRVAVLLTSPRFRALRRARFEFQRRLTGRARTATVFIKADDPYSYLLLSVLGDFIREHELQLKLYTIAEVPADMVPQPELLEAYGRRDVARLAPMYGCDFPGESAARTPAPDLIRAAQELLPGCEREAMPAALDQALRILRALWHGDRGFFADSTRMPVAQEPRIPAQQTDASNPSAPRLVANERRLQRMGHYNSAMLHYGGEWYWGVDRLWHLQQRLRPTGAPFRPAAPAPIAARSEAERSEQLPPCEFFFSFRSPYSYLAVERAFAFADRLGLELRIRPVLPMVMRGLKVPRAKRIYFLQDAGREAERNGIPFGRVCDPLGAGVERCMAGYLFARDVGREREFVQAASTMIWSEGVDVATDTGLSAVVERAGFDASERDEFFASVASAEREAEWRAMAEANQTELFAQGAWGVPVFRIGDLTVWGQDRFDLLEAQVRSLRPRG